MMLEINRSKQRHIELGDPVLILGEFGSKLGVWFLGELAETGEDRNSIKYWVQNPAGFPLQIRFRF